MKKSIKTILAVTTLGLSSAFLGTACVVPGPHPSDVAAPPTPTTQTTTRETVTSPGVYGYGVPATSSTTTTTTRPY